MNVKILIIDSLSALIAGLLMIGSDIFLRDEIFGANIILWPLSSTVVIFFAIKIIAKKTKLKPTFLNSLLNSLLITILSSLILSVYWVYTNGENVTLENIYSFDKVILPYGYMISLFVSFIYWGKSLLGKA